MIFDWYFKSIMLLRPELRLHVINMIENVRINVICKNSPKKRQKYSEYVQCQVKLNQENPESVQNAIDWCIDW